jgi:hypothetical protein
VRLCKRVMRPQSEGTRLNLAVARHAVSGTSIGYLIGWTIAFRQRYRAAPDSSAATLPSIAAAGAHVVLLNCSCR